MRGEMKISQDESQDEMGNEQTGVTGWGEQVYLSWQSSFEYRVYICSMHNANSDFSNRFSISVMKRPRAAVHRSTP